MPNEDRRAGQNSAKPTARHGRRRLRVRIGGRTVNGFGPTKNGPRQARAVEKGDYLGAGTTGLAAGLAALLAFEAFVGVLVVPPVARVRSVLEAAEARFIFFVMHLLMLNFCVGFFVALFAASSRLHSS